jgi:hypothetical protein
MGHEETQEAGWYPDPMVSDRLRLWDGEGWTERTQPWNPPPAPDDSRRRRRRRMLVEGAGLGFVLLVTGPSALPSWGIPARPSLPASSPSDAAGATSAPPTTSPPAVTVDCRLAASRPSPARVVGWLTAHGLAASPSAAPPLPAGACGVAGFTDAHGPGSNVVIAYPDPRAADAAAATPPAPPAVAPLTVVQGIYVLALDPGLADQRAGYQAQLVAYVSASSPDVVPATTTTRSSQRGSQSRTRP